MPVLLLIFALLGFHGRVNGSRARKKTGHRLRRHERPGLSTLGAARDEASFRKYGFDAETLFVRGAPTLVAAMASNEIEVGYTGGTAVIGAVASGSDLKVLSALTNRVTYDLVAQTGIKTAEDLRGKKFGVQAIGGTVWMGAILALEHLGLDPDRDKISHHRRGRSIRACPSASHRHHRCDRARRRAEPAVARDKGFRSWRSSSKAKLPILSSSIVAREPYIQKNPQIVENVLRAVIEGAAFCLSPRERPNTLKILQKYLRISEKDAEEGYKTWSPASTANRTRILPE